MYWADRLIQSLVRDRAHRVDDMTTPSGHAHVGSLRAITTHGLVYEAMRRQGYDVDFTYVINDLDPLDGLPAHLDKDVFQAHMGKPLCRVPAPDGVSASFARQYMAEFIGAFEALGFRPQIFWDSELYAAGRMNEVIRVALDNAPLIRTIYQRVARQEKPPHWFPIQAICEQCGKVGTTLVTAWDGAFITYECKPHLVQWAAGCGFVGRISPFDGRASLMWKVDWPAHWVTLGVTVEGAGKDHLTKGGSHDVAEAIMREVFQEDPPLSFLHEFMLIGGAKASASKGNAMSAAEVVNVLPPELVRFLIIRTPVERAINFDLSQSDTMPDLFDEYDRCARVYGKEGAQNDFGRFYEAAQLTPPSAPLAVMPRFRQVAILKQLLSTDLAAYYAAEKGSTLTDAESAFLAERIKYADIWLSRFAAPKDRYQVQASLPAHDDLTPAQVIYLSALADLMESRAFPDPKSLEECLFTQASQAGLSSKEAFSAIYRIFLDRPDGPRASWLLFSQPKASAISRLRLQG